MALKPLTNPMRDKLAASGRTIKKKHVESDNNNLPQSAFANA